MTNLCPVISVEIDTMGFMMAIDRLPSGAFRARVRIAGRSYAETFKTERAARKWETLTQARHLTGTLHGPTTVAEYPQVWLGGYEAAPAATMKFHATNLRLPILPAIGGRPIAKITPTDITGLLLSVQARSWATILAPCLDRAGNARMRIPLLTESPHLVMSGRHCTRG